MSRKTLKQQVHKHLKKRLVYGDNIKYRDQQADKKLIRSSGDHLEKSSLLTKKHFYSAKTMEEYEKKAVEMWKWANKEAGRKLRYDELEPYVSKYIESRIKDCGDGKITARTVAKEKSQLDKVFLTETELDMPQTHTESMKGRGTDARLLMERNPEQTAFYRAIGARKAEYHNLTPGEIAHYAPQVKDVTGFRLYTDRNGYTPNIIPLRNRETGLVDRVITAHAKHGKTNVTEILPKDQEFITEVFESGRYQDFMDPDPNFNVHDCRRYHAQELYQTYARPIEEIPQEDLYVCRGQYSGRIYDRRALKIVSEALGHKAGDDYDTVHNYLR